jgi:hypothetical protein
MLAFFLLSSTPSPEPSVIGPNIWGNGSFLYRHAHALYTLPLAVYQGKSYLIWTETIPTPPVPSV